MSQAAVRDRARERAQAILRVLTAAGEPMARDAIAGVLSEDPTLVRASLVALRERGLVTMSHSGPGAKWSVEAQRGLVAKVLPLAPGHVSSGGVPRRDCTRDGDCLTVLLSRESEPEEAQCRRDCAHFVAEDLAGAMRHLAVSRPDWEGDWEE